eukprot:305381_1
MEDVTSFYNQWIIQDQQHEAEKTSVQRLDNAIGLYYKQFNRNDYFDDNKNGKFLKYFEEQQYESDTLDEELGEDSNFKDCVYVKFDIFKDFPLSGTKKTELDTQKEIFNVLQHCYKYDIPPQQSNFMEHKVFEQILSSDDDNEVYKYNGNNNLLKSENEMLWKKINSLNATVEELKYEMNVLKQQSHTYKDKSIQLENDFNELSMKYKSLLEQQNNSMVIDVKNYKKWDCETVIAWICQLDNGKYKDKYNKLGKNIRKENITGKYLLALDRNDLHRLSITDFGDKVALLDYIQGLKQ